MPLPQTDLAYWLSDRYAKSSITIEDGDTDLDLCDLPFEVPRHEQLVELFYTMHPLTGSRLLANDERLRFDATSAVVSTPASPQSATQASLRTDRFVLGNGSRACPLPGSVCQHAREGGFQGLVFLRGGITVLASLVAIA